MRTWICIQLDHVYREDSHYMARLDVGYDVHLALVVSRATYADEENANDCLYFHCAFLTWRASGDLVYCIAFDTWSTPRPRFLRVHFRRKSR